MTVTLATISEAQSRISDQIVRTLLLPSPALSKLLGVDIFLKFENRQFTASFKERGALNRLLTLTEKEKAQGVMAVSAGNHAQALAYHGQRLGIPVTIVMPRYTPNIKVEQTRVFRADVELSGETFHEACDFALEISKRRKLTLVHPFDEEDVISGQGTLGLEMMEQNPNLETVVVPVGGGGLIGGVATAIKATNPSIRIIGVQADTYDTAVANFKRRAPSKATTATLAEGIAVKHPGVLTSKLISRFVDDMVTVSDDAIESAIFHLLEIEKTVVEGAGAAALAAVHERSDLMKGCTAVILSGGNIDMMTLSCVVQRGLARSSRLIKIRVTLPDVPGSLGALTHRLGEINSNIIDIEHKRMFGGSSFGATIVDVVLQLRGEERTAQVLEVTRRVRLQHFSSGELIHFKILSHARLPCIYLVAVALHRGLQTAHQRLIRQHLDQYDRVD